MCGQIRPVLIAGPHHERLLLNRWVNMNMEYFDILIAIECVYMLYSI